MLNKLINKLFSNELSYKDEFYQKLEKNYPEKVIQLLELDFTHEVLYEFLESNKQNEDNFDVVKFRKFLEAKDYMAAMLAAGTTASTTTPSNPNIGDLNFDSSTNNMKMYDGKRWITVK